MTRASDLGLVPNAATEDGRALGREMSRLCDIEEARSEGKRRRCGTCAFRAGPHVANGSPATLMDALKCVVERKVFRCHEVDRPCVGWRLLVAETGAEAPWDFSGGVDLPERGE